MTKNTVSIAFDQETQARFARMLGNRSLASGAHCGDEDGDVDGISGRSGVIALGAHCGDDDGVDG